MSWGSFEVLDFCRLDVLGICLFHSLAFLGLQLDNWSQAGLHPTLLDEFRVCVRVCSYLFILTFFSYLSRLHNRHLTSQAGAAHTLSHHHRHNHTWHLAYSSPVFPMGFTTVVFFFHMNTHFYEPPPPMAFPVAMLP